MPRSVAKIFLTVLIALLPSARSAAAQQAVADQPLPDVPALLHQVEANQKLAETLEKKYIYRSVTTFEQTDSKGQDKKVTVTEADHFWQEGVPVARVMRKNGKDLSADDLAKEDKRIDKETREARARREKNEAAGKTTDPDGREEITVSRLLELGSFTNPRRVDLRGRPTIAVDFAGDPHAKTRNRGEEVIRAMAGTAWIDEQDKVLVRVEGRFVNAFKVAGGLLFDIRKDTHFTFEQTRVNDEVWLPAHIEGIGAARAMLLFNFSGRANVAFSDYRKFRTSATVLPATSEGGEPKPVEPGSAPQTQVPVPHDPPTR